MNLRASLLLGLLAVAAHADVPPQQASNAPTIRALSVCIQPLGDYDAQIALVAQRGIKQLLGLDVRLLEPRALPDAAFYQPRKRYRAEKLLDHLEQIVRPRSGCDYVLGMTSRDISTSKDGVADWGVFGLGARPGYVSVVSTHRLHAHRATSQRLAIRVVKVVNHELGHNLGLDHCPTRGCLMEDARRAIQTVDDETGLLCERCLSWLKRAHGAPASQPASIDWKALIGHIP